MIAGRYTLDREIGRGGMGAVWLGRDEVLGREVALKRIGMMPGAGAPDLERAEREARLAARLNHPHVVAIFDFVTEGDHQWLVMEYVPGVTLAQMVTRDGALSPDEASPLIRQVADALAAAHAAGIVHRDVKPSNMLVTPDGHVKLSDFGIARAEADASLTVTGLVTGSPAYLAPEVASGETARDASDVWSVGATLFHALAGRPPYDVKDNLMGALYRIVHEEPPRLDHAGWLTPLLAATMATDPRERWSMTQVRDFLDAGPAGTVVHPVPAEASPGLAGAGADGGSTRAFAPTVSDTPASGTPISPAPAVPPVRTAPPLPPAPAAPAPRRSSTSHPSRAVLGGIAAVVVLLGLLIWAVLASGTDVDGPTTGPDGTGSAPTSTESTANEANEANEATMTAFIEDYLATATTDPASSFAMLTPAFQAQSNGLEGYRGFWGTISSATPSEITADPENLTIRYVVDYVKTDGSRVRDNVTLQLVRRGDQYLIGGEPS